VNSSRKSSAEDKNFLEKIYNSDPENLLIILRILGSCDRAL